MSLTKIKSKENKGKQKALPKLKAILANPNKRKCPVLDEAELVHLKFLLQSAIEESKLEPKVFATKSGICLGLESSLRKINNQTSSCVFISLSIKPNYVINLIARNAENKDERQPVFAQPKLEHFIQEIFSVQALCMVFPKDLEKIGGKLSTWVEQRRKPEKTEDRLLATNKVHKKNIRRKVGKLIKLESTIKSDDLKKESETKSEKITKPWSGDFISFGSSNSETKTKLDGTEAIDALTQIIDKLPTSAKTIVKQEEKPEPMEVDYMEHLPTSKIESGNTDSDDFLDDEYKALTVHKIKGNPNKKPKKKRKKNKNQIKK